MMSADQVSDPGAEDPEPTRRGFLSSFSGAAMAGGLAASYGFAGWMGVRYLYPAGGRPRGWLYVARVADLQVGGSIPYTTPAGERVTIARQSETGRPEDFIALSSTCPHLGCQVHWEPQNQRFFCPCHNGAFDPAGRGISGPPGDAGQSLPRYPLRIEAGLLYIEVPLDRLAKAEPRPGHDPCLEPRPLGSERDAPEVA